MTKERKLGTMAICGLLCCAALMGCAPTDSNKDAGAAPSATIDGMQPGAKVKTSVDSSGHKVTQYQNPDGSAGGSVELD